MDVVSLGVGQKARCRHCLRGPFALSTLITHFRECQSAVIHKETDAGVPISKEDASKKADGAARRRRRNDNQYKKTDKGKGQKQLTQLRKGFRAANPIPVATTPAIPSDWFQMSVDENWHPFYWDGTPETPLQPLIALRTRIQAELANHIELRGVANRENPRRDPFRFTDETQSQRFVQKLVHPDKMRGPAQTLADYFSPRLNAFLDEFRNPTGENGLLSLSFNGDRREVSARWAETYFYQILLRGQRDIVERPATTEQHATMMDAETTAIFNRMRRRGAEQMKPCPRRARKLAKMSGSARVEAPTDESSTTEDQPSDFADID